MAEPTLEDILHAIAEIRREMATKAETNARFDRVDAAIAELDADVERHMKVHKEIDKRSTR